MDDNKPQRVLDVVHPEASQQVGGWPFSVVLDNADLEKAANDGLPGASCTPRRPCLSAGDGNSRPSELDAKWNQRARQRGVFVERWPPRNH